LKKCLSKQPRGLSVTFCETQPRVTDYENNSELTIMRKHTKPPGIVIKWKGVTVIISTETAKLMIKMVLLLIFAMLLKNGTEVIKTLNPLFPK
jgi:hypothetical protein